MNTHNCNTEQVCREETRPVDWDVDELHTRAGALVREALAHWPVKVRQSHWEDMRQTAVMTFLEHAEAPGGYAYTAVRTALKNYVWVHIRGLNGGWKSLACIEHGYTVLDLASELDEDTEMPQVTLDGIVARSWDVAPRPVEWEVLRRLSPPQATQEETMQTVLHILAGMCDNFYPEQMYRAALIMTMLARSYTWEHIEERTALAYDQVWDIYWSWRKRYLLPYLALSPLHQEIIKIRGQLRITHFEQVDQAFLNTAVRKMIIFPHGIYTVTYKRRSQHAGSQVGRI
ncbi:MAG: hypothetical protein KF770_09450 [Anaerolineae bacterium]|nr:hypothetical protein [Anaerolineae bacterium]